MNTVTQNTDRLSCSRVLLIAPPFFGYHRDIGNAIAARGAQVDWLADRPFDTPLMKAITRFAPDWILPAASRLYRGELARFGASHYDFILIVNGQTLSATMLRELRATYPRARVILYMWDSMQNRGGHSRHLDLFDSAFTFDPICARDYGMRLRPLFFACGFEQLSTSEIELDVSFVGTAHTDRYAVVTRVKQGLPTDLRCYWYLYLQAPWVYYMYRMAKPPMRHARKDEFSFVPLPKDQLQRVFRVSKTILDIEHPRQRGLTMRTFETVGSHKKLITTNARVRDYDFFREENIAVIDRDAPRIPARFLATPYVNLELALYRKYSVDGWLDEVLGLESQRMRIPTTNFQGI